MKKILVFLAMVIFPVAIMAQKVTEVVAVQVAKNFYTITQSQERLHEWNGDIQLIETKNVGEIPTFKFQINNDFVVVAGDRQYRPVLAFSLDGNFRPTEMLPPLCNGRLETTDSLEFPARMKKKNGVVKKDYSTAWKFYETGSKVGRATSSVDPLMTTTWGQGEFYNAQAPENSSGPGGHVSLGCVAVGYAQYFYYYAQLNGELPGYGYEDWQFANYPNQHVDFGAANYDYSLMPDFLTSSTPADSATELAQFMADVAVGVHAEYASYGTAAFTGRGWYSALNNFSFEAGGREMYQKMDLTVIFTMDEWMPKLLAELDSARVIMYGGSATNGSWSHWFIIDGYTIDVGSGDTLFHCNWGWDGVEDGFFPLDFLAPGGRVPLDKNQSMIKNMQPEPANIHADTTISGVWNVTGSMHVRETATLTLLAGTRVVMSDGGEFLVHGALVVNGTASDPVIFTVADTVTDRFNSIRIHPCHQKAPQESRISHAVIEYSQRDMPGASGPMEFPGGGMLLWPWLPFGHNVTVDHLEVRHCAGYGGAGIYTHAPGTFVGLNIHDNVLWGNDSLRGPNNALERGIGFCADRSIYQNLPDYSVSLDSCIFFNNILAENAEPVYEVFGSAVFLTGFRNSPATITNSEFYGNVSYRGSAIYGNLTGLKITNCWFHDHEVPIFVLPDKKYEVPPEGVIFFSSADTTGVCNLDMTGCLFENNNIAAVWSASEDTIRMTNTTVRNCSDVSGGAFLTVGETYGTTGPEDYHIFLKNNIAWGDSSQYLVNWKCGHLGFVFLDIQNSDFEGGDAMIDPHFEYTSSPSNIDADPLFAENGQLLPGSPCINAGTPDTTGLNLPEFDIFGFDRVMYDTIDIGAAEYDGTVSVPTISSPDLDILVFPNPSNGNFTVRIPEFSRSAFLTIFSPTGQVVERREISDSGDLWIAHPELSSGMYFLKIQCATNTLSQKLLIK